MKFRVNELTMSHKTCSNINGNSSLYTIGPTFLRPSYFVWLLYLPSDPLDINLLIRIPHCA